MYGQCAEGFFLM